MRLATPRYPVDRYLVESSKKLDMVKIIDDDLWKPEPALRPEDEIMLRKLHGMLQSTADDLKLLSGELSKYHEPGVQVKKLPTPLDEDFNEKIHIEEVVNAKFHGHKIISPQATITPQTRLSAVQEIIASKIRENKPVSISNIRAIATPVQKKPSKKFEISRTNIVQIAESTTNSINNNSEKAHSTQTPSKEKAVIYKEIVHEYEVPKKKTLFTKSLNIQEMPSINIRSELKTQNVLQLDIIPNNTHFVRNSENKNNVAVVAVFHDTPSTSKKEIHETNVHLEQPMRKVTKMETYESSESSNNNKKQTRMSPKRSTIYKTLDRRKLQNDDVSKKDSKRNRTNLNEWKKKINAVYGQSVIKPNKSTAKNIKEIPKHQHLKVSVLPPKEKRHLNNTEYVPYSKLTLGGVNVKDIERELSQVSNKKDVPLSPILDKILSRQNSFNNDKSPKDTEREKQILTTSDENLLQEVLDIEEKVSSTLSKNFNKDNNDTPSYILKKMSDEDNTYADDFEIDNSEPSYEKSKSAPLISASPQDSVNSINNNDQNMDDHCNTEHNKTYVKISNLSFKNQIDTFEFIHTVDTQDSATQSNTINKISLKETQTSPRNENDNIQTIRNDLSIDPRHEVESMFKLEKDFIKKLIIDEYSDLIEKNFNKPSSSNDLKVYSHEKNISTIQKNTQTSPARVKNVMTSPTRTKTRTTSPFSLSLTLNKETSPMILVSNEEKVSGGDIIIEESKVTLEEEHNITINLSSPRFSLRIPQSSCDLTYSDRNLKNKKLIKPKPLRVASSSSSVEAYSSSDISFGEINREFKRRLRRHKIPSISEPSSSSLSKYSEHSSAVAPLRSEGELSVYQTQSNKYSKSEGEVSLGQLK